MMKTSCTTVLAKQIRQSLRSGALDGSQFSALSLGDALVETGSPDDALPYFEYAYDVAERMTEKRLADGTVMWLDEVSSDEWQGRRAGSGREAEIYRGVQEVIEQNRDAQLRTLLMAEFEFGPDKLKSVLCFDGTPISVPSMAAAMVPE